MTDNHSSPTPGLDASVSRRSRRRQRRDAAHLGVDLFTYETAPQVTPAAGTARGAAVMKGRRTAVRAVAATVAVLATVSVLGALVTHESFGPVVDSRPSPVAGTIGFHLSLPTASTASASSVAVPTTPASRVLHDLVSPVSLRPLKSAGPVTDAFYGGPFQQPCPDLFHDVAPAAGVLRRAALGKVAVAVTGWAYASGEAGDSLERLRARVASCYPDRDPKPVVVGGGPTVGGFTAIAANGGDGLAWLVWSRGDVTVSVTTSVQAGAPPAALAQQVAAHLDQRLVALLLANGCADADASIGQSGRNPYAHTGYRGYQTPEDLNVPSWPAWPTPTTPAPTPAPTQAPVSAPVSAPTGATAVSSSSAGAGGVPLGTSSDPRALPRPELAVPQVPLTWPRDVAFPDLAALPVGPAPVLVDPSTLVAPNGGADLPAEPSSPDPALTQTTVALPTLDTVGPGCGWAFVGAQAPSVNAHQVASARTAAVEAAFADLTSQAAAAYGAGVAWQQSYGAWLTHYADWVAYQNYQAQVAAAQSALTAAQTAYQDAVQAYEALRGRWEAEQVLPTDVPLPTSTPASATASPTASASSSPSASPTPGGEPSPSTSPTAGARP